jgi:type II secretory ATPase GspE/PulE/Tfp pilus assembly ATPase PilB-like protein
MSLPPLTPAATIWTVTGEVESLLREALSRGASDIHLEPGPRVRLRVGGVLVDASATLSGEAMAELAARCGAQGMTRPRLCALTVAVDGREARFRTSALPVAGGLLLSLHHPGEVRPDLGALGMPAGARHTVEETLLSTGRLLLFSGPAGSGKTASLQTSLRWIAAQARLVVSAEHPVEALVPGVHQLELDPEHGLDAEAALPSLLLSGADLIGFDEIRDWRTARAAVRAALAGRSAAATIGCGEAAAVISRLLNLGIEPFLLTTTLAASVSQRLLFRLCPACRQPAAISDGERAALEAHDGQRAFTAPGCAECSGSGRRGRVALFEVLELAAPIQELILQGASTAELRFAAVQNGVMTTLRSQALALLDLGEVGLAEVLRTPPDLASPGAEPLRAKLLSLGPELRERLEQTLDQQRRLRDGERDE